MIYFLKTLRKRIEFGNIFSYSNGNDGLISKELDDTVVFIKIENDKNKIFKVIKDSINGYLHKNKIGSINFSIIQDSVDRNCDAAEEEIQSLNPIPLYFGLIGTMTGIIVSIGYLYFSGGLDALMDTSSILKDASKGVSALLTGVALAMITSVVGIIMTIINTDRFKKTKEKVNRGRNDFLVGLQTDLLPVVSSSNDSAIAMSNVIGNLDRFNNNFSTNMGGLNTTLREINHSYEIIRDLDVVHITEANAKVFNALKRCTKDLESFVDFFNTINTLRDKWEEELKSSKAMKEIAGFFKAELSDIEQRKLEISKATLSVDKALEQSFDKLNETYDKLILELNKRSMEMSEAFTTQIQNLPTLHKELEQISEIPEILKELANEIKSSNEKVVKKFDKSLSDIQQTLINNTKVINAIGSEDKKGTVIVKSNPTNIITAIGIVVLVILFVINIFFK
ncbi:MAG: hypothetical protein IJ180_07905 [Bacteroidales bacterium]|nr:hypothetical protein [Bacteroidales bacterium]